MPPFDSSDDAIGFCGPDEGLGGLIVFVEIAVDGGFEIADGAEDAAPEPAPGKCSEEALEEIFSKVTQETIEFQRWRCNR